MTVIDDALSVSRVSPVTRDIGLDIGNALENRIPAEDMAVLGAIRTRRALLRSAVYARHADAIERITYGMAHGKPARPAPRPARKFLRLVAWNIERGKLLDGIGAYVVSEPLLREADILLLSEVDVGMARSGNRDVARELGEALGFEYVFGNSYLCLSRGNVRDGAGEGAGARDNAIGLHGNAVLSRFPLVRAESFSVAISKDKFHSAEKRLGHKKALWAEVDTPLGRLPVCAVHLDSGTSPARRAAQMRDVLDMLARRGLGERCVIGGDFNTNTYDVTSVPRIVWNVVSKLARGGVAHAMHHYVHPYERYERALFDELDASGFEYATLNAPGRGTTRYEVDSFDSESMVRDHLPEIAVKLLRWRLKPWNGVAPLKIDWFAGRGVRALGDGERVDGRESRAPTSLEKPRWDGVLLSDHDPIVVDVGW